MWQTCAVRGLADLLDREQRAALNEHPELLGRLLETLHAEDVAEALGELDEGEVMEVLRILPDEYAAQVLARMGRDRAGILESMRPERAAMLLSEMEPDERADAVQTLDLPLQETLLAELDRSRPEAAVELRELRSYPENTAGGIMTTAFARLTPDTKVWQAIEAVRSVSRKGEVEMITYVYILAFGDKLVGVVSLRDLILADPAQALADIMTENVVQVRDHDPQQEVAKLIAKYDFQALPVADVQGRMVGVITLDDVVDVVIEEATDDAHMMGAVSPMGVTYLDTNFVDYWRSRVWWLVVLFLGGFMTAKVLQHFQGQLATIASLVLFMPLIISTGGNAGSQSATLVIRALATDQIAPRDWAQVVWREATVGLALGLVVGLLGSVGGLFFSPQLALAVGLSIISVVTVGALLGAVMPLLIQRIGFDPAVSSTPFIASLSDVVGLLIYLSVAARVMHA